MRTWIEIIELSLYNNCMTIQQFSNGSSAYVLKSNAYGHGIDLIASFLTEKKIGDMICVANVYELEAIRNAGWKKLLLLLSYFDEHDLPVILHHGAICTIYSLDMANIVVNFAQKNKILVKVHIKIDTGMNRLGLQSHEIDLACTLLASSPFVQVAGVYTHCFNTATYEIDSVVIQTERFNASLQRIKKQFPDAITHAYGTGALAIKNKYDMVRCGSMIYGLWKSSEQKRRVCDEYPHFHCKQILRWKSVISSVKEVQQGEYIGYNAYFRTQSTMKVAVVPVGYADGYSRLLSGKSGVVVHKQWAPLCGYISMNMITVDVTHIPSIQVGDEVILSAPEEEDPRISLAHLGSLIGVPAIALSTGISPYIQRKLVHA